MPNIFDLRKGPYSAADQVSWSNRQRWTLVMLVFIDAIRVIVLSIPWLLLDLSYLIVPRGKKSVKGQTVLVGFFEKVFFRYSVK